MRQLLIVCFSILIILPSCTFLDKLRLGFSENNANVETILTQDELVSQAANLLSMDSSCKLPCFSELFPGTSKVENIEEFLTQFDSEDENVQLRRFETGGYGLSLFFKPAGDLSLVFSVENQLLSLTKIDIASPHVWLSQTPYDLPIVLNQLGSPDDIFVLMAGPPLRFSLVVLYNNQGVMFRYRATYRDTELVSKDEPLPICLHQEVVDLEEIDIWLQSTNSTSLVEEHQPDLRDEREVRPFWNIQRTANISVEEFTDFFLENPQSCLPTRSFSELQEIGYQF
jgi:hypothetical protein